MPKYNRVLSPKEKQELIYILEEMKDRGLPIPEQYRNAFKKKKHVWPVDKNGYFVKRDGTLYNATEAQEGFVASTSRYVLYFGGRGCVSGDTLIDGIPIAERYKSDKVVTTLGEALASPSYLKGKDKLFSLKTLKGGEVLVTDKHRVLTPFGWQPLSVLRPGDRVLSDGTWYGETEKEISSNYQDNYSLDFRLNDGLRVLSEQVSQDILHKLHKTICENNAQASPYFFHPSIEGYLSRLLYLLFLLYLFSSEQYLLLFQLLDIYLQFLFRSYQNYIKSAFSGGLLESVRLLGGSCLCQQSLSFVSGQMRRWAETPLKVLQHEFDFCVPYIDSKYFSTKDFLEKSLEEFLVEVFSSLYGFQMQSPYSSYTLLEEKKKKFQISYKNVQGYLFSESLKLLTHNHTLAFSLGEQQQDYFLLLSYALKHLKYSFHEKFDLQKIYLLFLESLLHDSRYVDDLDFSYATSDIQEDYITFFDEIATIKYKRFGEFYDISVPEFENYSAHGMYHHNSGKSAAGSQKALRKIEQGESGAVINPLFSDFKDSTWREFKQWIPWNMVVPSQRHRVNDEWQPSQPFTLVFTNGASVICKGLKNPDSARGPNINWLWYDESRNDLTGLAWKTAIASVRVGKNPQAWTTTTPMGMSHWLYEFFIDKDLPPDVFAALKKENIDIDELISYYQGSIGDNKENLDPGFYASILSSYPSGWLRQREVEGEFAEEGGKIGDARWFTRNADGEEKILDEVLPEQERVLRYWDLAATEKKQAKDDPDEMVGALVSRHKGKESNEPLFMVQDQIHGYWGDEKAIEVIANIARHDGPYIPVVVEQEPGAAGKITVAAVKEYFKRFPELQSHSVEGLDVKKVGDRVLAANLLWFNVAQEGRMYLKKGEWNKEMLKQLDGFTQVKHDDLITSVTNAMHILNPPKVWKSLSFLTV